MKKMNLILFAAVSMLIVFGFTACGQKTPGQTRNKKIEKRKEGINKESKILKRLTNKATNAMEAKNQEIEKNLDD